MPFSLSRLSLHPIQSTIALMISTLLRTLISALACHRMLVLENLALRNQIAVLQRSVKRPRLKNRDRLFWVLLSRIWQNWAGSLAVVKPETVIRWHRKGFRLFWTWKSRRTRKGRPAVGLEIRQLIRKISRANPGWGAPRIHGELQKLGITISQPAVSKYMVRHRKPPSQSWRTFLDNHIGNMVSVDVFTVSTVTFRVLFVFVILAHDRRRVVHFNVTDSPTAKWTGQQIVEAFPWDTAPRLPRSCDPPQREALASAPSRLSCLLSQFPNAPLVREGLSGIETSGTAGSRADHRVPDGWRAPSPLLTTGGLTSLPFRRPS
jgi:hypothetical protein